MRVPVDAVLCRGANMGRESKRRVRLAACTGVCVASLLLPGAVHAQSAAPTRPEVEQPAAPAEQTAPQVSVRSDSAFAEEPCSLSTSDIRVSLREVRFEGVGGSALQPALAPLLRGLQPDEAGDQPISVVCRIRDRINAALADEGYVARVQFPPQELQDGVLQLVVVAGRIIEMRVRGDVGRFGSVIEERLARIQALDPFNKDEAVRILLQANDVPGLRLQMALRNAGGAPGDLIGEVVVEAQSAQLLFNIQNFGSRQLGREIATLRGDLYGLTGLADRTYVSLSNSLQWDETHIGQIGHDMALNDDGLRLGMRLNVARSEPDIPNLTLRSESLIAGFEFSNPLVTAIDADLTLGWGFEVLNQATRVISGDTRVPFTHDQTRVLFASLDGTYTHRRQDGVPLFSLNGNAEIRKGIDVFGASKTGEIEGGFAPSRFEGDPQATVIRGELRAQLGVLRGLSLEAQVFGQWADQPLLNLEEFSVGNFTYGRGYDPGANGGDRAIAARVEPRVSIGQIGPVRMDVSGFYDVARIWNLDVSAGTEARRTLESVGGGIRFALPGRGVLDVTYAKPLVKALISDQERPRERLLVSLTVKLLPWGGR